MKSQIERNCPVCGDVYKANPTRLKWGRETTCSRACSYLFRADQMNSSVSILCAVCGKQFTRSASQVKGKYGAAYCSPPCQYTGRGLGLSKRIVTNPYRYTDSGRISLSRAGALAYAAGKTLDYPETEKAVSLRLTNAGIAFVHQQIVEHDNGAFVVDFFFPERKVVIELDRKATHAKKGGRYRDVERDKLLADSGIRVIRIEDNGVLHDMCSAVMQALAGL